MNGSIWSLRNDGTITLSRDEDVEIRISRERENEICKAFIDNMKDRKKLNSFLKKYNNLASIQESNMDEFVWLYVTEGCNDDFNELNKRNILITVNNYLLRYIL